MFIYVSGPYSAKDPTSAEDAAAQIKANIDRAREVGIRLAEMGHNPFIPHTNCQGWEDLHGVSREVAMRVSLDWVAHCESLFFIGPSRGANMERELAVSLGHPVYERLEDVPPPNLDSFGESAAR
ncbi:MAG: DUF4406 domain-containing protein [Oligoflexia bacterium]|nr:DUF4406 domain-containing protein [Oligoflexia bacterium]